MMRVAATHSFFKFFEQLLKLQHCLRQYPVFKLTTFCTRSGLDWTIGAIFLLESSGYDKSITCNSAARLHTF